MTARGINFLDGWIRHNIEATAPEDQVSVREMVRACLSMLPRRGFLSTTWKESRQLVEMVFAALEHRREEE